VILAGDVGGTKTNLALFDVEDGRLVRRSSASLASRDHPGLAQALAAFLPHPRPPVEAAGFGVAGPVSGGRVRTTNLPWVVDRDAIAAFLGGAPVRILNDLEATAWGVTVLPPSALAVLQEGVEDPEGNAAVIAAGTGLGEAILVRHEGRLVASASEGGHATFAPTEAETDAFAAWLRARHGHVSAERVVSGMGLEGLHAYTHDPARGGAAPHAWEAADVPAALARAAAEASCPDCLRAFGIFLRCYGSEAGNLALKAAATAGLYVGGGIAARNLDAMKDGTFVRAFRAKGRFEAYLARIPVRVILDESAPLAGAALVAARAAGLPV
jgi:glucokinase